MADYYRVTELRKNVYRITSAESVFMELFVGQNSALLFDTGYGIADLRETVREITDLPLIIVNSHGHLDHSCGNFRFAEDKYVHPLDMQLLQQHNTPQMRRTIVEDAKHTFDHETGNIVNILPASFDEEAYVNSSCGNLRPLEAGYVFDLGGMHLTVYHMPGHTKGSICLLYAEEKLFYAGDAMNPFVWLFTPEAADLSTYIATLEKARALDFEQLVFAHGPFPVPKDVLDTFLDAARNVNYESGLPFDGHLLAHGANARICIRPGFTMDDFMKPGFASVVINPEHMKGEGR